MNQTSNPITPGKESARFDLECPQCGCMLRIPVEYLGKQGRCKHCQGVVSVEVTTRHKDGRTLLHDAAMKGDIETAKLLIAHGADVNARDISALTPLHAAVIVGHEDMAIMLLAKGADTNAEDNDSTTPAEIAKRQNNTQFLRAVENYGNTNGRTPLYHAGMKGDFETEELLIAHSPEVNVDRTTFLGTLLGKLFGLAVVIITALILGRYLFNNDMTPLTPLWYISCILFLFAINVLTQKNWRWRFAACWVILAGLCVTTFFVVFFSVGEGLVNLDRLSQRQNGIIIGAALLVIGAIFFGAVVVTESRKREE